MRKEIFFTINGVVIIILLAVLMAKNMPDFSLTGHVTKIPTVEEVGLDPMVDIPQLNSLDPWISDYCAFETMSDVSQRQECIFFAKAIITYAYKHNPETISKRGCAGAMPLCDDIAKSERFMDIFQEDRITCCCSEEGKTAGDCSVEPLCDMSNDDRFEAPKSLHAGIRYMMGFFNLYRGNLYLTALGYHIGLEATNEILEELAKRKNKEISKERILETGKYILIALSNRIEDEQGISNVNLFSDAENYLNKIEMYYSFWAKKPIGKSATFKDIISDFGTYTINPSFSVNINYDMTEYAEIMEDAETLIENCQTSGNIKECIEREIQDFGKEEVWIEELDRRVTENRYQWHLGNCDETEEKVEQLVEDFYLCQNSRLKNKECVCDLNLDSLPENVYIELSKRTPLGEPVIDFILGEGESRELKYTLEDAKLCYFREKSSFLNFFGVKDKFVPEVDRIILTRDGDTAIRMDVSGSKTLSNILYKLDDDTFCFIPQDTVEGDNLKEDIGRCSTRKQHYRFCVESNQELFSKEKIDVLSDIDEFVSGELAQHHISTMKPVEYRFGLYFRDDPPPKITGLELFDMPKNRNSVIIQFDASTAEDVARYHIYYQDVTELEKTRELLSADPLLLRGLKDIDDMTTTEMKNEESHVKHITFEKDVQQLEFWPYNFDCNFDYDLMKCRFEVMMGGSTIEVPLGLENSMAYSSLIQGSYLYILPLELGKEYKIAVTAEDQNGNELLNVVEEEIAITGLPSYLIKDDIEFGHISRIMGNMRFTGSKLEWNRNTGVQYYENGEPVVDEEPETYSVFFFPYEGSTPGVCPLNKVDGMDVYAINVGDRTELDISLSPYINTGGLYCFGVVAERNGVRDYYLGSENVWNSALNLVTFAPEPNHVPSS